MFLLLKKSLQKVCLCFFLVFVFCTLCAHVFSLKEWLLQYFQYVNKFVCVFFLVVVCYVYCVHMYSISEGVVKVLAA